MALIFRSEYGQEGPVQRPQKVRPSTNVRTEGQQAWTMSRNEYVTANEKPAKAKKADDNLKPFDGQIEGTSLNRSEYGKDGIVERPEKVKPTSTLKSEGDFNWETGRYEYKPADEKPSKAKKAEDNLKLLDGEMDKSSQNRSEYGKNGLVQRSDIVRPLTTVRSEGEHTWNTGRHEYVSAEGKEKPAKAKKSEDNLRPFKGQIEGTSLNRTEYGKDGMVQRPEKVRPVTNLKSDGNFEWKTKRFEYTIAEEKPIKATKGEDNLKVLDGEIDKSSQNRSEYGKNGFVERSEMTRPMTISRPEGKHSWETGRHEFVSAEGHEKPLKIKGVDNLQPFQGSMDKNSTNR